MSRQIDWEQPLSDADRAWAEQFPGMHADRIAYNDQQFAGSADTLEGDDADDVKPYSQWAKDELLAEVSKRELAVPAKANKADLVAILEADDDAAES